MLASLDSDETTASSRDALGLEVEGDDTYAASGGFRISASEIRKWNTEEFYVWDWHGNLITFGAAPEEIVCAGTRAA